MKLIAWSAATVGAGLALAGLIVLVAGSRMAAM
jgi:hypothetical protein